MKRLLEIEYIKKELCGEINKLFKGDNPTFAGSNILVYNDGMTASLFFYSETIDRVKTQAQFDSYGIKAKETINSYGFEDMIIFKVSDILPLLEKIFNIQESIISFKAKQIPASNNKQFSDINDVIKLTIKY